jgi:hypothetical protein
LRWPSSSVGAWWKNVLCFEVNKQIFFVTSRHTLHTKSSNQRKLLRHGFAHLFCHIVVCLLCLVFLILLIVDEFGCIAHEFSLFATDRCLGINVLTSFAWFCC